VRVFWALGSNSLRIFRFLDYFVKHHVNGRDIDRLVSAILVESCKFNRIVTTVLGGCRNMCNGSLGRVIVIINGGVLPDFSSMTCHNDVSETWKPPFMMVVTRRSEPFHIYLQPPITVVLMRLNLQKSTRLVKTIQTMSPPVVMHDS
jgi:hypothetical protein